MRRILDRERQSVIGPLALCGWVLAGAAGSLAAWELGDLALRANGSPPPATAGSTTPHQAPGTGSGCSQARIDRKTGQTVIGDCPAPPAAAATLAAWVAEKSRPR